MKVLLLKTSLILSLISVANAAAHADSTTTKLKPLKSIQSEELIQDYKTAYYWAFYGHYSRDAKAMSEMISRLSDLTSKIYDISSSDAYGKYKLDILAQGGPQLTMASVGIKRILMGLQLGMHQEVTDLINSTSRVNPQLGASLSIMAMGFAGNGVGRDTKDYSLPPRMTDLDQCLQSCGLYFLGLQNNPYARGMAGKGLGDPRLHDRNDITQTRNRFPNEQKEKPRFRKGIDPAVAMSDQCFTTCVHETAVAGLGGAAVAGGTAAKAGLPPHLILGTAMVGAVATGATAALKCSQSNDCAKDQAQVQKEREASKLKAENDLKEQQLRKNDLQRKEKEQKDRDTAAQAAAQEAAKKMADKKAADAKAAEQKLAEEERKKQAQKTEKEKTEKEKQIRDAFDRSKNKKQTTDSSASCESTHSCSDTMNAYPIDDRYREPKESRVMTDGQGDILKPSDLTSTPRPDIEGNEGSKEPMADSEGNILSKMDLVSTPSNIEKEPITILTDGHGKVINKIDLIGTPGLCIDDCYLPKEVKLPRDIGIVSFGKK